MLLAPQSIISRLSPLERQHTESHAVLTVAMAGGDAAQVMRLSLLPMHEAGWHSDTSQAMYDKACARLAQWCVEHKHYANNVSIQQDVVVDEDSLLFTAADRELWKHPPPKKHFFQRQLLESKYERHHLLERRYQELPSWAKLVRNAKINTPVLVAAPLCLEQTGNDIRAYLCDYPEFVRSHDAEVELSMSDVGKQQLFDKLGSDIAAWHPFCRVLGMLRDSADGRQIEVLQVELAKILPDSRNNFAGMSWSEQLIWDAQIYAETMVSDSAKLREAAGPFWYATAALLPAWKKQLALTDDELSSLLNVFYQTWNVASPLGKNTLPEFKGRYRRALTHNMLSRIRPTENAVQLPALSGTILDKTLAAIQGLR